MSLGPSCDIGTLILLCCSCWPGLSHSPGASTALVPAPLGQGLRWPRAPVGGGECTGPGVHARLCGGGYLLL